MDLSSGQQRLLFGVVVIALAGLGIYLISGTSHHGTAAAPPSHSAAPSTAPSTPGVPPATLPAATPPAAGSGPDIYQWLPFSQQDLAAAARTTTNFAAAYSTWSYTETKKAYAAKLDGLATPEEAATLLNGWSTAGLASTRAADKQVSTGSGTITAIRSFGTGPVSITFLVTIAEQLASTTGTTSNTSQYAVTVIAGGGGWQVNDIELAGLGNH